MNPRAMSPAEAAVMEGLMPGRVAESTAVLALCLYEALVLGDARAGAKKPAGDWQRQLEAWAHQVIDQIRHVSAELGGFSKYLAKNQGIWLSERDQAIWQEFAGPRPSRDHAGHAFAHPPPHRCRQHARHCGLPV